jgi:hypothetical protein
VRQKEQTVKCTHTVYDATSMGLLTERGNGGTGLEHAEFSLPLST